MKPIPVVVLTYRRPLYFDQTIRSFISRNKRYVEKSVFPIYVIVQERDEETDQILEGYKRFIKGVRYLGNNVVHLGLRYVPQLLQQDFYLILHLII